MKRIFLFYMCLVLALVLSACAGTKSSVKKKLNNIVEQYNSGKIDYDEALSKIESLENDLEDDQLQYADDAKNDLLKLKNSKGHYEKGIEDYKNEDYSSAINELNAVIKSDDNYKDAQTKMKDSQDKYKETVFAQVDKYLEKNQFDEAKELLDEASSYIDDDELSDKIAEVDDAESDYNEEKVTSLEDEAETAYNDGDYKTAIEKYKELYELTSDETYNVKVEGAENDWIDEAIANAESYLSQGLYDEAEGAVNSAYYNVSDVTKLDEEIEKIESYRPITINDTTLSYEFNDVAQGYKGYCYIDDIDDDFTDSLGNSGHTGIEFTPNSYSKNSIAYREYLLNGEYDKLKGTITLDENSRDTSNTIVYNFYSDGNLIYTANTLTGGVIPFEIEMDITGTTILKIECVYTYVESRNDYYGTSAFIDTELTKTYTSS